MGIFPTQCADQGENTTNCNRWNGRRVLAARRTCRSRPEFSL